MAQESLGTPNESLCLPNDVKTVRDRPEIKTQK